MEGEVLMRTDRIENNPSSGKEDRISIHVSVPLEKHKNLCNMARLAKMSITNK
jgi:hypothetical protein